ncbi:MAG: nucleotidyltransferase domain-containing protein [Chloroflexota bacterium]
MRKYKGDDRILNLFVQELRRQLEPQLREVILFGSRARGEAMPDSDYDCLAIVDEISPAIKTTIADIVGEFLYQYDVIFAVFPMSQEMYQYDTYEPLLMNVRQEGILL